MAAASSDAPFPAPRRRLGWAVVAALVLALAGDALVAQWSDELEDEEQELVLAKDIFDAFSTHNDWSAEEDGSARALAQRFWWRTRKRWARRHYDFDAWLSANALQPATEMTQSERRRTWNEWQIMEAAHRKRQGSAEGSSSSSSSSSSRNGGLGRASEGGSSSSKGEGAGRWPRRDKRGRGSMSSSSSISSTSSGLDDGDGSSPPEGDASMDVPRPHPLLEHDTVIVAGPHGPLEIPLVPRSSAAEAAAERAAEEKAAAERAAAEKAAAERAAAEKAAAQAAEAERAAAEKAVAAREAAKAAARDGPVETPLTPSPLPSPEPSASPAPSSATEDEAVETKARSRVVWTL